ncbi:hypothetical protein [Erwinia psidii]|uniref:hypothetical protein n=1 Tax=Erwinia psidii TaxID=69224 RepID=UPI00226B7437|nr:hypothetical protein [Erwinia psidii]
MNKDKNIKSERSYFVVNSQLPVGKAAKLLSNWPFMTLNTFPSQKSLLQLKMKKPFTI